MGLSTSVEGMKTLWNNTFEAKGFFNIPLGHAQKSNIRICSIIRQVFFAAFPHSVCCCVVLSVAFAKILGFL